ncbi:MAG: hypothetical protein ACREJU_19770 [Nitrospiraceae bacterium]
MGTDGGSSGEGKAKQIFWTVAAGLLVVLVGYNLYSGRTIEEIGLGGIGSVKFGKHGEAPQSDDPMPRATALPPPSQGADRDPPASLVQEQAVKSLNHDEMERRQAELEAKLRKMEEAVKRAEASPVQEEQDEEVAVSKSRQINLTGTWHDRTGVSWIIHQNGNHVTVQEMNPLLGVTAVGQGTLTGRDVELTYMSAMQTTGQAALAVSPDGRNLTGTAHDLMTGASIPLMFTR